MHVYSCHIQSQLVTRAVVRSGNFKNYSPRSLREINRTPGQTSRFIHASHRPPRFFPSTRPHFFPSLYAYFIIFFPLPLVYSRPRIRISLIPLPLFNICTHARYRLTISSIPRAGSLLAFVIGSKPKPKTCRDSFHFAFLPPLFVVRFRSA